MVGLVESWNSLREEIASRSRKLAAEAADAWNHVQSLTAILGERLQAHQPGDIQPASVESLERLFSELAQTFLFEPHSLYRKKRPLFSVVAAIQEYETGLDSVVQRLPATAKLSGADLLALAGAERAPGWRKRWLSWQRAPKDVPLRAAVSGHLEEHILRRGQLDGAFQLELARACLHLLGPWQILREHALRVLSDASDLTSSQAERQRWAADTEAFAGRFRQHLEAYQTWADAAADRLTASLILSSSEPSRATRQRRAERQQERLSYWSRQQRAVQTTLELELALAEASAHATNESRGALESVQAEHEHLLAELDTVIEWLERWSIGKSDFPPPQVRLTSAEEHGRAWARRVLRHGSSRLPAILEVVEPRDPLPGPRRSWRDVEPEKAFAAALDRLGTPAVITGFREVVAAHQVLTREIERAREVVAFGEEAARAEGPAGHAVAAEAVQNALSLLLYQRKTSPEIRPVAEASLVKAQARLLLECHTVLEKGRVGLLAHLTRQRGLEAVVRARGLFVAGLRAVSREAWRRFRRLTDQALIRVGWLAPPRPQVEPVGRRARLGQVLDFQVRGGDLPMIYRRLFRLAPIEDPRFLVGRESEMAGLAEAVACWNSGQRAAVLIVGARGSGKTSLLNCAASGLLAGMPVVRGQFHSRVVTASEIRDMSRSLLQLPDGSDVAHVLSGDRRVVIVEELERSFLRVINGFDGLRDLFSLIYQTSASTLWIFSINETAFRYLDAVVGLGRHFSHRINAMSVTRQDLTGAILQRHDLSGLRLEFAPLPEEDPRVSRARRLLGLEQDPEQMLFDSLYRQSEGIFRAALELWQRSIQRVEGGVVHMRQPLIPDYGPLLSELSGADHFILQAILQHGGLTVEEVAQVTRIGLEDSARRLERLRLLEILEPEPEFPGLRVRPEAGLFVREALHRQNLW